VMQPRGRHESDRPGTLVVSIDFELEWGVRDTLPASGPYRANLEGVREVVPALLDLFSRFGIRATWAVVGMLMAHDRDELAAMRPSIRPRYEDSALDPYRWLDRQSREDDHLRFAPDLVAAIAETPGQEIGTHTFSHYYCLEPGQDRACFRADLEAAVAAAATRGWRLRSLVFPRNQVNPAYLDVLPAVGLRAFRAAQGGWMYRPGPGFTHPLRRAGRLADAYLPCSRPVCSPWPDPGMKTAPYAIPAHGFWRPISRRLEALEGLRVQRVLRAMRRAADTGGMFHLWWHPHNFGAAPGPNLAAICQVLHYYRLLHDSGQMVSRSMGDLADALDSGGDPTTTGD